MPRPYTRKPGAKVTAPGHYVMPTPRERERLDQIRRAADSRTAEADAAVVDRAVRDANARLLAAGLDPDEVAAIGGRR